MSTSSVAPDPAGGRRKVGFAIPRTPEAPASLPGSVCLTPTGGAELLVGGTPGLQSNDAPPTQDGVELNGRVAVWFLPTAGENQSLISLVPEMFRRAALFRPGIIGPWTYYLLVFALLPALLYAALRLLATSGRRGGMRLGTGVLIAVLAFANAAAWALITPAFQAPDESEHFAYAQYFAETGRAIGTTDFGERPPYSTQEAVALEGIRLFSSTERADGRPPWLGLDERRWNRRDARVRTRRDDGGGYTVATSAHTPAYYGLLAPPYLATRSQSTFSQLTAMRLVSALLGAIVALCAFLVVRELVPRHPVAAVGAALIVAFQPMFGFMSGAVNNDMGVNAGAAVLVYLLIRGLRRGLTPRLAVAIGAMLAITPLLKGTGYALYPAALVALAAMLWRQRGREHLPAFAALVGSFIVLTMAWGLVSPLFERTTFATPGGAAPASSALAHLRGVLSYIWQVFLPRLPFMNDLFHQPWPAFDIYVVRGWGAFGWYAVEFPMWVYAVILAVMLAVAALTIRAVWLHRAAARALALELVVLVVVIAGVIGGVEVYYYAEVPRETLAEFGRYAFPAITALASLAIGSAFAFPRRLLAPAVAVLVVLVLGLSYASQLLTLAGFYA